MLFLSRIFVTSWCSLTFNRPSLRMTFTNQIQDVALLFREQCTPGTRPLTFYKQYLRKTNPMASIRKSGLRPIERATGLIGERGQSNKPSPRFHDFLPRHTRHHYPSSQPINPTSNAPMINHKYGHHCSTVVSNITENHRTSGNIEIINQLSRRWLSRSWDPL